MPEAMTRDEIKNTGKDDRHIAFEVRHKPGAQGPDSRIAKLKILSGPHGGAIVDLHAGAYTIGSSDECDFVLKSPGVASEHFILLCRNNTYTALKRDGEIYSQEIPLSENEADLALRSVYRMGSVHFGLLDGEDDWDPTIPPPAHEAANDHDPQTEEDQAVDAEQKHEQDAKGESIAEDLTPKPQVKPHRPLWRSKLKWRAVMVVFGAAVLVGLYAGKADDDKVPTAPDTTVETIAGLFQTAGLAEPFISYEPATVPEVIGYAKTVKEQKDIADQLQGLPFEVNYSIYSGDALEAQCRQIIARMEWLISVECDNTGSAVIKGFITDNLNGETIAHRIMEDVGGIRKLDKKLWHIDDVGANLNKIMGSLGLSPTIKWQFGAGHVVATGTLQEGQRRTWDLAKERINTMYNNDMVILEEIKTAHAPQYLPGRIHLPLTSVTLGRRSYITMEGGKRYFQSGLLKNGGIVKDIGPDRIVIEIGGLDYHYTIGNGVSAQPGNAVHSQDEDVSGAASPPRGVSEAVSPVGELPEAVSPVMFFGKADPEPFDQYIQEAARRFDISLHLIKAVIKVESNFNPKAVSVKGAKGLMQIMPSNFQFLNITDPFDPKQNIMGGARYLSELLIQFDHDVSLALAAYNAGPHAVVRYQGIPPYRETQNYVQKVLKIYVKSNATFGNDADEKHFILCDRPYIG